MKEDFTKKVESLVENHLQPMIEEAELGDSRFFQTSMYKIKQGIEKKGKEIEQLAPEEIEDFICQLLSQFKNLDVDKVVQEATEQNENDLKSLIEEEACVSSLIELFEKAWSISPFLPFLVLNRLHLLDFLRKLVSPIHLLNELEEMEVGEHRAIVVMQAFGSVVENLYKHYLKMLWELWKISEGEKKINTTTSFGNVLNNLKIHLPPKYHNLIDNFSALIRNSAQHYDWIYDPSKDNIVFINQKNVAEGYALVEDVWEMVERMYFLAGTCIYHLQQYYIKKIFVNKELLSAYKDLTDNIETKGLRNLEPEKFKKLEILFEKILKPISGFEIKRV